MSFVDRAGDKGQRVGCDLPGCRKSVIHGTERHEQEWALSGGTFVTYDFCSVAHQNAYESQFPNWAEADYVGQ